MFRAPTATAQERDQGRTSYATVTSIMGTDWEDDWFEDYEEGDQLDEQRQVHHAGHRPPNLDGRGQPLGRGSPGI